MSDSSIRVEGVPRCPVCGGEERSTLYVGLKDHLFGVPGEWTLKECRRCGLAFLDPRPTPEDVIKAYKTYYTHLVPVQPKGNSPIHRFYRTIKDGYLGRRWGYHEGLTRWQLLLAPLMYLHPSRKAGLDFTVMYLKATPGGRLLDVGCGSGMFMKRMRDLGWHVEGVDFDKSAVYAARERGHEVRLGTLESQKYPEVSFDAITMSHVIEHVHDLSELLRECRRILKPGGRLVVVTPNLRSLGHKRFASSWRGLEPPRHLYVFDPRQLVVLARQTGFRKVDVFTTMQGAHWMYEASRAIQRADAHALDDRTSWAAKLRGRVMQHLEWAALKTDPYIGEELVAVLEK